MKKFLLLATSAFVVSAALPAFAADETPVAPPAAEASKGGPRDGHGGFKGRSLFDRGDKDGDGAVSKAEFLAQSEEQFKVLDTDGDGKITKAEIEEKREKMKQLREKRKQQMGDQKVPGSPPATDKPAGTSE